MTFGKREILISIVLIISIFLCKIIWPLIELPFLETDIVGEYSLKQVNSMNDIVRYFIFISLPLLIFIFLRIKFYNLKPSDILKNFKIKSNKLEKIKNIYFFLFLFLLYLIIEFFSLDFSTHKIDIYHEGQKLSSAYKSLLDGSLWSGSYVTVGIIYETIGTKYIWKIFNHESIGLMRILELFYILVTKISLIFLLLEFTKLLPFNSFQKSCFFILTNFLAFNLIDYNLYTGDTVHYREIPIIISLILISRSINNSSILNLSILGFFAFFTFLWSVDRGIVLTIFILIFSIFLIINSRYKDVFYILLSCAFFFLVLVIYDQSEFLYFIDNTKSILKEMNQLNGLIHPTPFSDDENSTRATKNLIIILLSLIFTINLIVTDREYFSKNLKISLFFLSIISFLSYLYALSRSDGPHIKQAFGYSSIFIILILAYILILFVKKIKINQKNFYNIKSYVLFSIVFLFIFMNVDLKNISTFKKRFNEYIYFEDKIFLIEEDVKFISSTNKIISNEDCIHLATSDSALYYLLRKPSCTRFYFSWSIGSKKNQVFTVNELKLSKTNFVILNGLSDNWSSSFETKHPIIFEFINNNFKKSISLNNRILLYK